jgi:hypothetical protein
MQRFFDTYITNSLKLFAPWEFHKLRMGYCPEYADRQTQTK